MKMKKHSNEKKLYFFSKEINTNKNLPEIDLEFLKSHLSQKKDAYFGDKFDMKIKALVALGVGITLDSSSCILNNVKMATTFGVLKDEIMEAFKIAKFSKSATILSSSNLAFEWLKVNLNKKGGLN